MLVYINLINVHCLISCVHQWYIITGTLILTFISWLLWLFVLSWIVVIIKIINPNIAVITSIYHILKYHISCFYHHHLSLFLIITSLSLSSRLWSSSVLQLFSVLIYQTPFIAYSLIILSVKSTTRPLAGKVPCNFREKQIYMDLHNCHFDYRVILRIQTSSKMIIKCTDNV